MHGQKGTVLKRLRLLATENNPQYCFGYLGEGSVSFSVSSEHVSSYNEKLKPGEYYIVEEIADEVIVKNSKGILICALKRVAE